MTGPSERAQYYDPRDPADRQAVVHEVARAMDYASVLVFVGRHPDLPAAVESRAVTIDPTLCLSVAATSLRRLADQLDAAHGPADCGCTP
ncbi:hypothetical protein [Nocardia amikacinitolerans]|uniref:hypothetical protein n=1 Tax=Nocardia amikacinitolerans TaxID=756689 RepID=UPI0020A52679|nr:hypothetical protein [Nocardia amikacinitolerans]MCP2281078.1 hypothetical protein [Nocardia amikacinitolerans]